MPDDPHKLSNLFFNMPQLSERERASIDTDIDLVDIEEAIDSWSNQNSPGCDGIATEFYKKVQRCNLPPFVASLSTCASIMFKGSHRVSTKDGGC